MAGLWFEEFKEGMVFDHEWTRTLTETDNKWFSLLTLGCMVGMTVNDTTFGTTIANLGMTDVKFPHPLFEGDTIHMRTIVIAKRESKSRPEEGIVTLRHECYNQENKLCGSCDRAALMRKRPKEEV